MRNVLSNGRVSPYLFMQLKPERVCPAGTQLQGLKRVGGAVEKAKLDAIGAMLRQRVAAGIARIEPPGAKCRHEPVRRAPCMRKIKLLGCGRCFLLVVVALVSDAVAVVVLVSSSPSPSSPSSPSSSFLCGSGS